jgi:leader peptidase (prepilin peptidase)/N-methyltransferase
MAMFASIVLVALLLLISIQDIKTMRIADGLNALLAIAGAIWWLLYKPANLPLQVVSAFLAAFLLWSIRYVHSKVTGRIGLGLGDVKLIGAGMVWVNPNLFPLLLFSASASGLVGAFSFSGSDTGGLRSKRIPFGPFLAFGVLVCWFLEMVR